MSKVRPEAAAPETRARTAWGDSFRSGFLSGAAAVGALADRGAVMANLSPVMTPKPRLEIYDLDIYGIA